MIRFKDKVFEQYSICPATGDIFDAKTGEVQKTYLHQGRPVFKGMKVHCIMVHTYLGYRPGFDVHHLDENTLNNALSNLVYLTHEEHVRLHATVLLHDETRTKNSASHKGRHPSEETRAKMRKPKSEETRAKMRKPKSDETKAKIRAGALRRWSNRAFL